MLLARYSAARQESICKYLPEPSRKISTSKICEETATHSSLMLTNLQCNIERKIFTSNVGAHSSRNSRSKDMDCDVSPDGGTNEKKTRYLVGTAELLWKFYRHGNRKLAKDLLQFLFWSKLPLEDYK